MLREVGEVAVPGEVLVPAKVAAVAHLAEEAHHQALRPLQVLVEVQAAPPPVMEDTALQSPVLATVPDPQATKDPIPKVEVVRLPKQPPKLLQLTWLTRRLKKH